MLGHVLEPEALIDQDSVAIAARLLSLVDIPLP